MHFSVFFFRFSSLFLHLCAHNYFHIEFFISISPCNLFVSTMANKQNVCWSKINKDKNNQQRELKYSTGKSSETKRFPDLWRCVRMHLDIFSYLQFFRSICDYSSFVSDSDRYLLLLNIRMQVLLLLCTRYLRCYWFKRVVPPSWSWSQLIWSFVVKDHWTSVCFEFKSSPGTSASQRAMGTGWFRRRPACSLCRSVRFGAQRCRSYRGYLRALILHLQAILSHQSTNTPIHWHSAVGALFENISRVFSVLWQATHSHLISTNTHTYI